MSLILEGIDLPNEGEWLSVIIKPTKDVIVDTLRYEDFAVLDTEYGSAIQIPKGHGRLIDADALEYKLGASDEDIYVRGVLEEDAPTILEAEESDGNQI